MTNTIPSTIFHVDAWLEDGDASQWVRVISTREPLARDFLAERRLANPSGRYRLVKSSETILEEDDG